MKHLHILLAVLTIAIFIYQAAQVFSGKSGQLPKIGKILGHVIYTLLILEGIGLVMPLAKSVGVPIWVVAKVVLFVVAISATIKATRANTPHAQARAGIIIAAVAYMAIVMLAFSKPAIGFLG